MAARLPSVPSFRLAAVPRGGRPPEEWRPVVQTIPTIDLYRELEVDPAASAETIDAAWKSLLKRHHPDVTSDAGAAHERVKRLNLAHEWLSDPERRALYDRSRRRPGVVVVPRVPRSPAGRPRPASAAAPAGTASAPTAARAAGAGVPPHNPYAEYDLPNRPSAPRPASPAMPGVARRTRRPLPPLLIPIALLSVLAVVAVSSFVAAMRPNPGSTAGSAAPAEAAAAAASGPGESAAGTGAPDPRTLAQPNLKVDVPTSCHPTNLAHPFSFETVVAGAAAEVYVVRCADGHSAGPLLYVASRDGWRLAGKLGTRAAVPYRAVSGAITGSSPDEFGIAWTTGAGTTATLTLYRATNGITAFWDSSSIGLAWSLPRFTWQGSADPTAPGTLVVVSADLATGTPDCVSCRDHQLYRQVYAWDMSGPTALLRQQGPREPFGVGLP